MRRINLSVCRKGGASLALLHGTLAIVPDERTERFSPETVRKYCSKHKYNYQENGRERSIVST